MTGAGGLVADTVPLDILSGISAASVKDGEVDGATSKGRQAHDEVLVARVAAVGIVGVGVDHDDRCQSIATVDRVGSKTVLVLAGLVAERDLADLAVARSADDLCHAAQA